MEASGSRARPGMAHASLVRMQPPTSNDDARSDERVPALGTIELVSGIVEDARDLFAAHVEALRDDISARLVTLGATIGSMLIAIGVFVVTGLMLCLAIAATLTALGAAWWVALWLVTLAAAAIGVGFVLRARTKARAAGQSVTDAAERVRNDVTKIGDATATLFISPTT
jgi:Putative Actinobacterial Holin-X, holin superfamily III